jgi:hypothetical protein
LGKKNRLLLGSAIEKVKPLAFVHFFAWLKTSIALFNSLLFEKLILIFFQVTAENIPSGSTSFSFVRSDDHCYNCWDLRVDEVRELDTNEELPGGCSNAHAANTGLSLDIEFNYKALCPGQIVGIALGVTAFVVLAGAGLAIFASGSGSFSGADKSYAAL